MKKLLNFSEFINESINEGAVKQFEMGVSSLINNIKSGYGWIDPSYVFDTFNQSDEFYGIDWDNVKGEIFQRLIDNGLLYYSSDTDPEQQGRKVTSVKQIQESVNEAVSVPSNVLEFAKRKGSYATALVKKAAGWAEKAGKRISDGTAIGKNYSTIILDMKHHGSEIYINLDDETIELFGEPVTDAKSFAKVLATNESVEVNEGGKDEQVKKECISRLSDFFRVTPNSLSKFNFDGKDNIKELTRALNSISDQGTELYYQTAIKSVKRDLGVNESIEVNEANAIKVGIFVRYKKDKDFTGGKVISIKGNTVEINNWDGSTTELPLKDLEYVKSWNESEINEDMGKFVSGTLNTPFDTLKMGDVIKLDALDYTRRGDMDKITCVLPDGNKAEILKKHITVKL